jgi:hypothetical protein
LFKNSLKEKTDNTIKLLKAEKINDPKVLETLKKDTLILIDILIREGEVKDIRLIRELLEKRFSEE